MTTSLQCSTARKKLTLAAAIALFASVFSGYAQAQGKPADASQLDIGGVRLYMSADEAVTALKNHYGANANLNVLRSNCQFKPSAQCVSEITYQDGAYKLSAKFVEKFPRDDVHPDAVYDIHYDANILRTTEADRLQLQKSAVEKYGPATVAQLPEQNPPVYLTWCAARPAGPIVAGGIVLQNARRTGTDICDPEKPTLGWNRILGTLELVDAAYQRKVLSAYQQSTTAKPKL
jgi:hypothetical protein